MSIYFSGLPYMESKQGYQRHSVFRDYQFYVFFADPVRLGNRTYRAWVSGAVRKPHLPGLGEWGG